MDRDLYKAMINLKDAHVNLTTFEGDIQIKKALIKEVNKNSSKLQNDFERLMSHIEKREGMNLERCEQKNSSLKEELKAMKKEARKYRKSRRKRRRRKRIHVGTTH